MIRCASATTLPPATSLTAQRSSRTASSGRHRRFVAAAAAGSGSGSDSSGASAAAAHAAAAAAAAGRDGRREAAVLGGEDFILSQRSGVEEALFKGEKLGVDADVAGVGFRQSHLRSLAHLPAGLQAPPRFLDRVAVHFARNLLAGSGMLPGQVPLVLGIWGPKGGGKSFGLELCLRTMGVLPVCLSAGELEDEWAGEPGRRLRERYEFAARHAESTGEATCLVISDLDAGVGAFANTQNTVNSQNLQGALMALCDDPTLVSTGQEWGAVRPRGRVPIFATMNDPSRLYAPLVREGRMDKFYYEPSREEMAGALRALFAPQLGAAGVEALLDAFPAQPMDFFGAIRSRLVDASVRRWLQQAGAGPEGLGAALLSGDGGPALEPEASLEAALAAGTALAAEQQSVLDIRLSREYMKGLADDIELADERQERWRQRAARDAARRRAAAEAAEAARAKAAEAAWAAAAERRRAEEEQRAAAAAAVGGTAAGEEAPATGEAAAEEEPAATAGPAPQPPTASGLAGITPDELAAALKARRATVLDVRGAREWDWGRIKGAKHAAFIVAAGSSLTPEVRPNPGFLDAARAALGPPSSSGPPVVLCGPGAALDASTADSFVSKEQFVSVAPNGAATVDGQDIVAAAAAALQGAGYPAGQLRELVGGYRAWDLAYRPDGRRRAKGAFRDKSSGELEWWTASN